MSHLSAQIDALSRQANDSSNGSGSGSMCRYHMPVLARYVPGTLLRRASTLWMRLNEGLVLYKIEYI